MNQQRPMSVNLEILNVDLRVSQRSQLAPTCKPHVYSCVGAARVAIYCISI
ncbi:hypothetical protein [Dulcicalothrix desertica]|uniref:hypothetical protein n=1 Tax=Dulcicalothrix desertica TaxID=32056 RepID=UPI0013151A15|nr:hypothetical protein [Dulcicalothrix desertica]